MFNMYNYAMRTCVLPNVLRQLSIYNAYNYSVPVADGVISRPNSARVLSHTQTHIHIAYTYIYIHTPRAYIRAYIHIVCTYIYIYLYMPHTCTRDGKFYLTQMSLSLKPKYPLYVGFSQRSRAREEILES